MRAPKPTPSRPTRARSATRLDGHAGGRRERQQVVARAASGVDGPGTRAPAWPGGGLAVDVTVLSRQQIFLGELWECQPLMRVGGNSKINFSLRNISELLAR